jgi:hypothetical protein
MRFGLALMIGCAVVATACGGGGEGDYRPSTSEPTGVMIDSITPGKVELGGEITIRGSGFTAGNDVGFENEQIDFQGSHVGYLSGIPSDDGETLRVTLPDNESRLLGACAMSQLKTNEACEAIGLLLAVGESGVFIVNDNGVSNRFTLNVTARATPAS